MRRIKVKLAFNEESYLKRKLELMKTAKILSEGKNFIIVEEEHYEKVSYIVILVKDEVDVESK